MRASVSVPRCFRQVGTCVQLLSPLILKKKKKKKSKRDHVTSLLKELHWVPVKYRIQYKLVTLAFRHFDGTLPPYLSSSLCTCQPSRSLRYSTERLRKIPKTNLKNFGERSFGYIAPALELAAGRRESFSLPPKFQI